MRGIFKASPKVVTLIPIRFKILPCFFSNDDIDALLAEELHIEIMKKCLIMFDHFLMHFLFEFFQSLKRTYQRRSQKQAKMQKSPSIPTMTN